jgi:hypothetical protein
MSIGLFVAVLVTFNVIDDEGVTIEPGADDSTGLETSGSQR